MSSDSNAIASTEPSPIKGQAEQPPPRVVVLPVDEPSPGDLLLRGFCYGAGLAAGALFVAAVALALHHGREQ